MLPTIQQKLRSIKYNDILSTKHADVLATVSNRGAITPRDIELAEPLAEQVRDGLNHPLTLGPAEPVESRTPAGDTTEP